MFGDGIVSFGVAPSTVDSRNSNASAKIVWSRWTFSVTRSAAGVHSTVPCSLRNWTLMSPGACSIPPSWKMKSMCQVARRNSPSVADCSPASRCSATTSRIASSSTARSASASIRPAA